MHNITAQSNQDEKGPDPTPGKKPQEKVTNVSSHEEVTSENTNAPDIQGEQAVAPTQESGKKQEGDESTLEKTDITGKRVDNYIEGDSGKGKSQLNG